MSELVINRSDRASYRLCRKQWWYSSPLQQSLAPVDQNGDLWAGVGFHFALEDYEGPRRYPRPRDAFMAYVQATIRAYGKDNLPEDYKERAELICSMLDYYVDDWLESRDSLTTAKLADGSYAVEVKAEFDIPVPDRILNYHEVDRVVHKVDIDRIAKDAWDATWVGDYKTATMSQDGWYEIDSQNSTYMLAVQLGLDLNPDGFMYQVHFKKTVDDPRILKKGDVSADKRQGTNYRRYKKALKEVYGDIMAAPDAQRGLLDTLFSRERPDEDPFIRRVFIPRPQISIEKEYERIQMEAQEMLDPDTNLYFNPGFHCNRCAFREPCIADEYGEDTDLIIKEGYRKQGYEDRHTWLKFLSAPEKEEVNE